MKKDALMLLASVVLFTPFMACQEEESDYDLQLARDVEVIENYLTDNSLSAERFNNYIYKVVKNNGSGEEVDTSKIVEAIIQMETLDGEMFYLDSSYIYQTKHGFYQIILEEGSGTETIGSSSTVVNLDYKGYLFDGTIIGEGNNITLNPSGDSGFSNGS